MKVIGITGGVGAGKSTVVSIIEKTSGRSIFIVTRLHMR